MRRQLMAVTMFAVAFGGTSIANEVPAHEAPAPAPCVIEDPARFKILQYARDPQSARQVRIETHPCAGGLYLRDEGAPRGEQLHVLTQAWWLDRVVSLRWSDERTLHVRGEFYAGAGPTAAQVFAAELFVDRTATGWRPREPHLIGRPWDEAQPLDAGYMPYDQGWLIENMEQLEILNPPGTPEDIDFAQDRLVVIRTALTNGSETLEAMTVKHDATGYAVDWTTGVRGIGIGNTSMQTAYLWATVPADGLPVRIGQSDGTLCTQCAVAF
ncbi:MAG: hypothetical protein AAFX85_12200 [Pseudomonadota bacterium]